MPRLIDADKVAEAIDWLNEYDFVLWHDVMECIDKVPTVDAERHGHWKVEEWINTIICSECGNSWHIMDNDTETFNYCPNCGAKMDEERKDLVDEQPTVDFDSIITKHEDIGYEKGYRDGYAEALEVTEDVKRHGHWIKANDPMSSPFDTMKRCLCSECREWAAVTSYCPNCGARMDEVKDEESV